VAPAPGLLEVLAYFLGILAAGFKLSRRDVEDRLSPNGYVKTQKGVGSGKRNLRTLRAPQAASRNRVEKFTQADKCVRRCIARS
jgi:hypothetical protein